MATLPETTKVILTALPLYPNFKLTVSEELFCSSWQRHVGHLGYHQLQAAMDRAVRGSEFFPSVHDVLAAAAQLAAGEGKTGMEAWAELQSAIREHGYICPPDGKTPEGMHDYQVRTVWHFADPIIAELLPALGGWHSVCMSENMVADRAHFVRAYELTAARNTARLTDPQPPAAHQLGTEVTAQIAPPEVRSANLERMAQVMAGIGRLP